MLDRLYQTKGWEESGNARFDVKAIIISYLGCVESEPAACGKVFPAVSVAKNGKFEKSLCGMCEVYGFVPSGD